MNPVIKFNTNFPLFPVRHVMTKYKNIDWRGKKLRINWSDGTHTDYPAKSLPHYLSLLRLANDDSQLAGRGKKHHRTF